MNIIEEMIQRALIKREENRLINISAYGEELTQELNEIQSKLSKDVKE